MANKGNKLAEFFKKLYRFRVKVDRKGKPVVNVSSLFALACLIFAPRLTIAGVIISLVMGYQIGFETEHEDEDLEERIRQAAQNVKTGAMNAVKSVQEEIKRARGEKAAVPAEEKAQEPAAESAEKPAETPAGPTNEDLLQELTARTQEIPESNPAATTFHSAYSASAGSVPVLHVEETDGNNEPSAPAAKHGN